MSKLLNQIKSAVKEKALEENFKSDDGVSEVPDVVFDKKGAAVNKTTKNPAEKDNEAEDNKKIVAKKGNADSDNKKDIKHKKLFAESDDEDADNDVTNADADDDTQDMKPKKVALKADSDSDDDDDDNDKDGNEVDIKVRKVTKEDLDIEEHVDALLSGEDLSEEFKSKVKNIFEMAVIDASNKVVSEVVAEVNEAVNAREEEYLETMVEKLDTYLDKVVNEWQEENRVAIQRNVRTEIAESFLAGLKTLFEEHYIDIADEKVDIVEELVETVEKLQSSLDEEINANIQLRTELSESRKETLVAENFDGLTENQKEKFKMLAEGLDYTDDESFVAALEDVKKSYFTESVKTSSVFDDEDPIILAEEEDKSVKKLASSEIGLAYASMISKHLGKNR